MEFEDLSIGNIFMVSLFMVAVSVWILKYFPAYVRSTYIYVVMICDIHKPVIKVVRRRRRIIDGGL